MKLRNELTAPNLDDALVTRLARIADRLDGARPEEGAEDVAVFNRLADSELRHAEFQGIYKAEDAEDFVRRGLYSNAVALASEPSRDELVEIVRRATKLDEDTFVEREFYLQLFLAKCPHPSESDLLFYPEHVPEFEGVDEPTAEQVVDVALAWRPRIVAMRIAERAGSNLIGYLLYRLEAPGIPTTQVTKSTDVCFAEGTVVAAGLKGAQLPDGSVVQTNFEFGPFSNARILEAVEFEVGTEIDLGQLGGVRE